MSKEVDNLTEDFEKKTTLKKKSWFEQTEEDEKKEMKETPKENPKETPKEETKVVKEKTKQASIFQEEVDLKSQMHDKSNPLYSEIESFEELKLSEQLLKNVHIMGWNQPSGIQSKTIPLILNTDKNIIAQSQSGTGKTACFALGMLSLVDPKLKTPQALCIVPTLELAFQIFGVTEKLATDTGIKVEAILKGSKWDEKVTSQILIGTPGKIEDLIKSKKKLLSTKDIKLVVFDEADEMLKPSMGSLKEQSVKIKKALPSNVRVLLFSATFQDEDDEQDEEKKKVLKKQGEEEELKFLEFAAKVVPEPVVKILIPKEELSLKKIRQYSVECKNQSEKYQVLKNIYSDLTIAQCIIFVNTRETANKLTEDLRRDGFPVSLLHGKVDSSERKIILQDFQEAKTKVLITTNVLSRGVDIRQVTHVINYDPPMTAEKKPDVSSYLHRIGRTGRFGREGIAINLISGETDKKTLNEIVKFYEKSIISISPDADFGEEIK